jgi:hypothetical protein
MEKCKPWGSLEKAKVLVIGHDPTLINVDTIGEYCFFANYYMEKYKNIKPTKANEKKRYDLARALYLYIYNLTNYKYKKDEIYITNLCNNALPRPSSGTVYIPREEAINGLNEIYNILKNSNIEKIFVQSVQVNYWLQELGMYSSKNNFVELAVPIRSYADKGQYVPLYKIKGIRSPFYDICGNKYMVDSNKKLFPIIHVKQYNNGECGLYKRKIELCKRLNI